MSKEAGDSKVFTSIEEYQEQLFPKSSKSRPNYSLNPQEFGAQLARETLQEVKREVSQQHPSST